MADLAARRGAEAADFADRIRREVIVEHEALSRRGPPARRSSAPTSLVPSVVVPIAWVSPRVNRAEPWVRGRKPTIASIGRTVLVSRPSMRRPSLRIAVRTMSASRFLTAFDRGHLLLRVGVGEGFLGLVAGGVERGRALRLVGQLVGGLDVLADQLLELVLDRGLVVAGGELPRVLGGLLGELDDRLADLLATRSWANMTAPSMTLFRQLLGFGFDHHHRVAGAGDDEVELAFGLICSWVGLRIYSPSM